MEDDACVSCQKMTQEHDEKRDVLGQFTSVFKNETDLMKISEKARQAAMFDLLKPVWTERILNMCSSSIVEERMSPEMVKLLREVAGKAEIKRSAVTFVTINPRELSPEGQRDFIEVVNKYAARKKHVDAKYCFETRSGDSTCTGFHVHMLIRLSAETYASAIHNETYKKFQRFVGTPQHVHVRMIHSDKYQEQVDKYIGKEKHADDQILRQRLGLPDVVHYTTDTPDTPDTPVPPQPVQKDSDGGA